MEISEEKLTSKENITFITRHYRQNNFTSPRHYHLEYEIAYIEESKGKLYVGNNIVEFGPGNLFIFAPKLVHCFKNNKISNPNSKKAKATVILFKKEFLGNSFLERKEAVLLNKLLENAEAGIQIFIPSNEVISLIKKLSFNNGLKSVLDLLSILDYLSKCTDYKTLSARWVKKHYYKLNDGLVNKIIDYMEVNFSKENIYKNAVEMSGMSTSAFSRYFKHKTEKTFTRYVNELRITHAQKMLINTDLMINDICSQCGFNNLTYFNRTFKSINNLSPRHFRNLSSLANE
jgi:AraC-like DNA-binding protein